ncbi:hypothetical protein [Ereboglobus luteus]|uniref:SMP-30/Gluconolactonase/LRE-like region domain-containing protein n=1 Tax=Ereboglobus luteus TaxID=1796921 RepID=A0A2U8E6U4_9BACT|nr:hypothetical protein [Ereboglobus luteus]AWI10262.1 hypothetical protein CKA38_14270 [Ereboglobus luteus]
MTGPGYEGTNTAALTILDPYGKNGWQFHCAATNALGSADSATVTLDVRPNLLPSPAGIAVAPGAANLKLHISDTTLHTVSVVTNGTLATIAGQPRVSGAANATGADARFNKPRGLALTAGGDLLVADTGNHQLRAITTVGGTVTTIGAGPDATLASPAGIAATDTASGPAYIADTGNHLVKKISPSGEVSIVAGSATSGTDNGPLLQAKFNAPAGVAVDVSGDYVYVADTNNHVIRLIDLAAGSVTTFAGQMRASGTTDGDATLAAKLNAPSALAVDTEGNVYIADTGNARIRVVTTNTTTLERTMLTLAGNHPGFTDGSGTNAWFDSPSSIALADDGALYIADTGNAAIRRIAPDDAATVTTLALVSTTTTGTTTGTNPPSGNETGGGGGGGAPSLWHLTALALFALARCNRKK